MKQVDELLVRVSVEDQGAAVGVKCHFKDATLRPGQPRVSKTAAIVVKADHGSPPPPCCCARTRDPNQAAPISVGLLENNGPSPSAIVRWVMTASRKLG